MTSLRGRTRQIGKDLADWMEERTGILLLFYYVPTSDNAWDSIYYIMNDAYFGWYIRGIHFWSANALLLVIGLHMMRTFLSGSYKAPREMNWVVGVFLILIVTILAFSGYALRWDQEGFWAWEVGAKIASYTPFIGGWAITTLLGGDTAGPATLSRVFALHVWLLPAALAPLIGIHLFLLRKHGEYGAPFEYSERLAKLRKSTQKRKYLEEEEDEITEENVFDHYDEPQGFFPGQVVCDLTVSAILLVMVIVLAYWVPAPLTEPAEVSTTVYVPRPEWFFFFLDQWLVFFPGAVLIAIADVIVPALFVIWLLAIPWLDKEPSHSMSRRPYIVVISFLVITVIVLNMILAMVRIANFPGGTPPG